MFRLNTKQLHFHYLTSTHVPLRLFVVLLERVVHVKKGKVVAVNVREPKRAQKDTRLTTSVGHLSFSYKRAVGHSV